MQLELVVISCGLYRRVALGSREGKLHGFVEKLESLDLLDSLMSGLRIFENNERLTLGSQVRLGDDFEHVSIFRKNLK